MYLAASTEPPPRRARTGGSAGFAAGAGDTFSAEATERVARRSLSILR